MNILTFMRIRRRTGNRNSELGQALIEFAFMLPVLVLFILGIVDFAMLFMRYQAITDTAREGARMAVIVDDSNPDPTTRRALIEDAIKFGLSRYGMNGSGAQVLGDPNAACDGFSPQTGTPSSIIIQGCGWAGVRAEPARVVIRVPNDLYMVGTFLGLVTGDRIVTLSTGATMRNE